MKKISIIYKYIIILIFILIINIQNVKAATSDSQVASFTNTNSITHISTKYTTSKTEEAVTTYQGKDYNQRVHVFFQEQTKNSKIVSWAVRANAGKFALCPVTAIAKDYEAYHPGWKVVGGINADQYTTGFGENIPATGKDYYSPQPYYSMICDGEGWFIMTGIPVSGAQSILGFKQDGSDDFLINGSTNPVLGDLKIEGMFLYILDTDGNRLQKFQVHHINETPRELETTVWTSCYNSKQEFPNITVNGNLFVVERAEKAICNNSIDYTYKANNNFDAFFGKGTISLVTDIATFGYGAFAIDTKDENLNNALQKGTRVLIQYEIEGEFDQVESAIGYHTIHRMNGVDIPAAGSYNTNKYTRSIVGRTADGKAFLMAVDQTSYSGMNWEEINACLKHYGIVEAYQMDGGGSTTAIVRDNENFKVINSPRDGSPRSVFSALLLVEKVEEPTSIPHSITDIYKYAIIDRIINKQLIRKNNKINNSDILSRLKRPR